MIYYSKYLFILFLVFSKLFAQNCGLSGYVYLADSDHQEGIMIQLLDTTATKLFQFRTTDSTGHFKFDNLKKGFYKVYITQFGYSGNQILVQCNQANIELKNLQLMPLSVNLEEISVIDKMYKLKKSGDTTIFNIKAFESGSEQSVTDIVGKIPGFTVNGTKYFFQNKPIKKVLIDGKDVADDNHIEFTDAIHYETVEDLRIIEHYSDSYQPYKDRQDNEIVLDIKIKAKYKNQYQGTLYVNGGYNKIYDATANLVNTNNKTAFRVVVASSNANKNTENTDITSIIEDVENNILFKGNHYLLSQVDDSQNIDFNNENFFTLNSNHVKIALDTKVHEKYRLKSNLMIRGLSGSQNAFSERHFISDISSTQNFSQLNTQNIWMTSSNNHLAIAFNSSTNVEVDIPISLAGDITNASEDGAFMGTSYNNRSAHSAKHFSIIPIYRFHKTFPNKITLSIFGRNGYTLDSGNLSIFSKDSIAGAFLFDPVKSLFLTDQNNIYKSYSFNNQARLRKKIQNIDFQYNVSFGKNTENITNTSKYTFDSPFIGREKLEFTNFTHSLRAMYDKRPFRFVLGLIYAYSNIEIREDNKDNNFFRPNILLMYRLNSKWNISSSYSTKIYQPSILQINNLQTLYSQLSVWEGDAGIQDVGVIETCNFSLFKTFEIGEETSFFNMTFSFNPKITEILPVYNFDSFFQIKSYQVLEKENQLRFQLFYNKKFRLWNYNINFIVSESKLNIEENITQDKTFTTTFLVNYLKFKNIRISSGIDIRLSARQNNLSNSLNVYLRPRVSVGFDQGMFQGRIWYQLIYNQINTAKNSYHVLNFELARKKVMKNFELNVALYDILNTTSTNVNATTFNPVYIQTDTYRSFPGQILAGLKWYFRASKQ